MATLRPALKVRNSLNRRLFTDSRGRLRGMRVPRFERLERLVLLSAGQLQFSPDAYSVSENQGFVQIEVSRTQGAIGAVSVQYATSDGTATAGSDYTATSGTLNFADGQTTQTCYVPILLDSSSDGTDTFGITLSNPTGGAVLGTASAASVSINDSPGVFEFSASQYTAQEGTGPTNLIINRVGGAVGAVSVQCQLRDDTATYGVDYTASNQAGKKGTEEIYWLFGRPLSRRLDSKPSASCARPARRRRIVIGGLLEDVSLAIAAVEGVIDHASDGRSCGSWHDSESTRPSGHRQ